MKILATEQPDIVSTFTGGYRTEMFKNKGRRVEMKKCIRQNKNELIFCGMNFTSQTNQFTRLKVN